MAGAAGCLAGGVALRPREGCGVVVRAGAGFWGGGGGAVQRVYAFGIGGGAGDYWFIAALTLPHVSGLNRANTVTAATRQLLDDVARARSRAL